MITIEDVAAHWGLTPATVRVKIARGQLRAVRIAGRYRTSWPDVWSCETGRRPTAQQADLYRTPLLSKADVAALVGVSVRTIERWIAAGLPTRNIGGTVRLNRHEAGVWLRRSFGVDLDGTGARLSPEDAL